MSAHRNGSAELAELERQQQELRRQTLAHLQQLRLQQQKYYQRNHRPSNFMHKSTKEGINHNSSGVIYRDLQSDTKQNGGSEVDINSAPRRFLYKSQSVGALETLSPDAVYRSTAATALGPRRVEPVVAQRAASVFPADVFQSERLSGHDAQAARQKLGRGLGSENSSRKWEPARGSRTDTSADNGRQSPPVNPPQATDGNYRSAAGFSSARNYAIVPSGFQESLRNDGEEDSGSSDQNFGYFSSCRDADSSHSLAASTVNTNGTGTPQKMTDRSFEETPKSILRHRQIIDKNVHVDSKFEHTPTAGHSRKNRRGLNFSYTDVDDAKLFGHKPKSVNFQIASSRSPQRNQLSPGRTKSPDGSSSSSVKRSTMSSNPAELENTLRGKSSAKLSSVIDEIAYARTSERSQVSSGKPGNNGLADSAELPSSQRFYYASTDTCNVSSGSSAGSPTAVSRGTSTRVEPKRLVEADGRIVSVGTGESKGGGLLLGTGNDRKNARIVRDLETRTQSSIFSADLNPSSQNNKDTSRLENSRISNSSLSRSNLDDQRDRSFSRLIADRQQGPLLGYDWIAGVLDNERTLDKIPDNFFDEVREFRRLNRDACVGNPSTLTYYDPGRPITPEIQNPTHTCIHGYTVNDRLFTEPVNVNANGNSVCPSCLATRKDPTSDSPGFVRVSIPRSTIASPYKVKPHRRRSFDETDSCALAQHCLAGWECSAITTNIPTASTLDLKQATNGLRTKMQTTEEEVKRSADAFSRVSRLVGSEHCATIDVSNKSSASNARDASVFKPIPRDSRTMDPIAGITAGLMDRI